VHRNLLLRMLARSIRHRAGRAWVAILAVTLGSSLVAALANVSFDIQAKARRELRAYGANLVLAPNSAVAQIGLGNLEFGTVREERYLSEEDLAPLREGVLSREVLAYAPYLYGAVEVWQTRVTLVGVDFEQIRRLSPWWRVSGQWPGDEDREDEHTPALIGVRVARRLGVSVGDVLEVRGSGLAAARLAVVGLLETGAASFAEPAQAEDMQIFVHLRAAQRILGKPSLVSNVQVSAAPERRTLSALAADLERAVRGAKARVVGQIAEAEATILEKVRLLVGLVAGMVLISSGLAVGSTMAASVLERTREIGLLRALGAEGEWIALLFLMEAATIGLIGGVTGYLLGLGLAAAIGHIAFSAPMASSLMAAPLALGTALIVCLLASILPIRRALNIEPARTLRGE